MPGLEPGTRGEKTLHQVNYTYLNKSLRFFNHKDIPLHDNDDAACYTIPQKQNIPKIIIRFANRKHTIELLKLTKKLKGTGVYVREHLTKRNAEIARQARIVEKEKRIQDMWTRNCKAMIKFNGNQRSGSMQIMETGKREHKKSDWRNILQLRSFKSTKIRFRN